MANKQNDKLIKKYWQIGITFGLSIGLTIYILGILLGGYLDDRFASEPLYMIIGTVVAILASFYRLIHDLSKLDRRKQTNEED